MAELLYYERTSLHIPRDLSDLIKNQDWNLLNRLKITKLFTKQKIETEFFSCFPC